MTRILNSLFLAVGLVAAPHGLAAANTLLHFQSIYADGGGKAFRDPEGIACTEDGKVVVADTSNERLLLLQMKDGKISAETVVKFAELGQPVRVEIDSKGNVLAFDQKTRRVVRVGTSGEFAGFVEPTGVPAAKGFFPSTFKLDSQDNLYLLDVASARVVVLAPTGAFLRQVPLPRDAFAVDVVVDPSGTILALDAVGGRILSAARGMQAFSVSAKNLREYLTFPGYLTAAGKGRWLVVDEHGHGLVTLGPDFGYQGRQLSIGWTDGLLYYPGQACVSANGDTFVTDRGNHRIQIFTSAR